MTKRLITICLLIFVAASVVYLFVRDDKGPSAEPAKPEVETKDQLIVYYFHGDQRCPTCHKLENYAKEAIESTFSKDLADGVLVWRPMNVDRTENKHFIQDYQLVTKSVVLSQMKGGREIRWKNLDQIWKKVKDKADYMAYIRTGIEQFIQEGKS